MDMRLQCLGILLKGAATGYEIKKLIETGPFSHFLEGSFAAIYPALAKLTEQGLVRVEISRQGNRLDKKVYAIEPAGRDHLLGQLTRKPSADSFRSPWLYALYFADHLPAEAAQRLFAQRIAYCEEKLSHVIACKGDADSMGSALAAAWGVHMYQAELAFLKAKAKAFAKPVKAKSREAAAPHTSNFPTEFRVE